MNWIKARINLLMSRHPTMLMLSYFGLIANIMVKSPIKKGLIVKANVAKTVLKRPGDFEVSQTSAPKMIAGNFIHGMDLTPRYKLDKEILTEVLEHNKNLEKAREITRRYSKNIFKKDVFENKENTEIDLFSNYIEPIVTATIVEFYGLDKVPEGKQINDYDFPNLPQKSCILKGSGLQLFARLLRAMGSLIALTHPAPFGRQEITDSLYQKEIEAYLIKAIEKDINSSNKIGEGSILQQLIACEKKAMNGNIGNKGNKELVKRTKERLSGILSTSTAINKAFANIVEELFSRKENKHPAFNKLKEIVSDYHVSEKEEDKDQYLNKIRGYLLELLRFNIAFPMLPRYCPRDTTITSSDNKEHPIKKGTIVKNVLPVIMFDDEEWPSPYSFCPHRPQENYMHFGYGQHLCNGKYLVLTILEEMIIHFLSINNIENLKIIKKKNDGPTYDKIIAKVA